MLGNIPFKFLTKSNSYSVAGVTTMLNFFTTSNGFRSNLPVVSNLTAMNLWDAVCMGFIYTSFLEFVVVNYLARWVQDPDIQKRKRDNAILDVSGQPSVIIECIF